MNSHAHKMARFAVVSLIAFLAVRNLALAADGAWRVDADGNWGVGTNWTGGVIANGSGFAASFTNDISATRTVTLDLARTIGNLNFSDHGGAGSSWVLAASGPSATLTLDNVGDVPNIDTTSGATIGVALLGTDGFKKTGSGVLILTGANTYGGTTDINDGSLQVGNGGTTGTLGTGDVTMTSAARLVFNRSDDITVNNAIGGDGELEKKGAGKVTLTNANSYTGITTVSAGSLQVGNGGSAGTLGTGGVVLSSGASLIFNRSDDFAADVAIDGSGSLVKQGAGKLTLTQSNSYGGTTTVNAGSLQVGDGGFSGTLGTGSVSLTAGTNLIFNRSDDLFIDNAIGGGGNLTKTGGGTVTLTQTNSYSGTTAVNAGTLQIGDGSTGTLGGGNVTIGTGATLRFSRSNDITVNNAIGGSGSLTQAGAGTTTLTNANSYAGTTSVESGALQVGNGGTTGTLGSGGVTLSNNAILIFNRSDDITIATVIGGFGGLQQSGSGKVTLTNSNSYEGTTSVEAGSLQIGNGSATGTLGNGPVSVTFGKDLIFNRSDNITIGAEIGGEGNLVKLGNNQLTLVGFNTYTGTTTVTGGSLRIGNNGTTGTLGTGGVTLASGTSLIFNRSDDLSADGPIGGDGSVVKNGNSKVTLTQSNSYAGTTTVNAGSLQIDTTGTLGSGSVTLSAGTSLIFNRDDDTLVGNAIGGSGNFVKTGSGTLTLTNANSYTGTTAVNAGSLQLGDAGTSGTLGSGSVTLAAGTSLIFNRNDDFTVANAIGGSGNFRQSGYGTLTLTNTNTYAGTTQVENGSVQVGAGGTAGTLGAGGVTLANNNTNLIFNRSDDFTVSNAIGGDGNLEKKGAGKLTLTSSSSYTGSTTVNGGSLQVGNGGTAGTLGTGRVTLATGTNLTFNRSDDFTVSNDIEGGGDLIKQGSNTLTLTGSWTYTGTTSVNAGSLRMGNGGTSGTLETGSVTLAAGTSLIFSRSDDFTAGMTIGGGGNLAKSGNATLTLTGANTYTGTTTVNAGTLQMGEGGSTGTLGTGSVSLGTGTNLTFNRDDDVAVSNSITGSGSVTKVRFNTVILTGSSGYTGPTNVNAGALQIGNGGISGSIAGATNVTLAGFAGLIFNRSDDTTFANAIGGTGDLFKRGAGKVTLTHANTYTGTTTVDAGTLEANPGALASSSQIYLNGGNLLFAGVGDHLGNGSSVFFYGGNLALAGFSEIGAGPPSGSTAGLGALHLDGDSTLDFGAGNHGNSIQFAGLGSYDGGRLNIINWDGAGAGGGSERLLFTGNSSAFTLPQNAIAFNGSAGYRTLAFSGYYEIVPIPEPSVTMLGASGLLALAAWRRRRSPSRRCPAG